MKMTFDPETVQAVVSHMNSDHSDACLLLVQAFSDHVNATQATMTDVDSSGMVFEVTTQTPENHDHYKIAPSPVTVRLNFDKPLRQEGQIRGMLVAMTRQARQKLGVS